MAETAGPKPQLLLWLRLRLRLKDQIIAFNYLVDQHQKCSLQSAKAVLRGPHLPFSSSNNLCTSHNSKHVLPAGGGGRSEWAVAAAAAAAANGTARTVSVLLQLPPNHLQTSLIPGSDQEPPSLDPNSLGSGGVDGKSILTPIVKLLLQQLPHQVERVPATAKDLRASFLRRQWRAAEQGKVGYGPGAIARVSDAVMIQCKNIRMRCLLSVSCIRHEENLAGLATSAAQRGP